jgi:hypothetical protein
VSISVADSGLEIPAEKLQNIFRHFTQADSLTDTEAWRHGAGPGYPAAGAGMDDYLSKPISRQSPGRGSRALAASGRLLMEATGGLSFAAFSLLSFHSAVSPPLRLHPADLLALCGSHGP